MPIIYKNNTDAPKRWAQNVTDMLKSYIGDFLLETKERGSVDCV